MANCLFHRDNELVENFCHVVGQFTHGNCRHISQVLQLAVNQSTTSVATEVATSVATSLASPESYTLPPITIKTENLDFPPLIAKKKAAKIHRKNPLNLTTVSFEMVNNTIQYLQMLSDCILVSDTISSREWATIHLATQLLQSRYKEIIVRKEVESRTVSDLNLTPTQPGKKY
ncbi:unnamed protein product [Penicillium salamii]|nr:unnamed protein product [Penicillium salamii]